MGATLHTLLSEAPRPCRHAVDDRWFVDETYVKAAGVWRYVYRAVDQHGQIIDAMVFKTRDLAAARKFFTRAIRDHGRPNEVTTDLAAQTDRTATVVIRGHAFIQNLRRGHY